MGRVDPRGQVVQGLQDRQDLPDPLVQAAQDQAVRVDPLDLVDHPARVDLQELSLPGKAPG